MGYEVFTPNTKSEAIAPTPFHPFLILAHFSAISINID
jgi:hypothetical protein